MTPADLRAWQGQLGYTYDTAAAALGVSRATYARWLAGPGDVPRTTALACSALAAGLGPWVPIPVAVTSGLPDYISHTDDRFYDRRIPELQPDGQYIIRDPVTGKSYDPTTGAEHPHKWSWLDNTKSVVPRLKENEK